MNVSFIKSVKSFISDTPKNVLVFAGIGVITLLLAAIFVISNQSTSQKDVALTSTGAHATKANPTSTQVGSTAIAAQATSTTPSATSNTSPSTTQKTVATTQKATTGGSSST